MMHVIIARWSWTIAITSQQHTPGFADLEDAVRGSTRRSARRRFTGIAAEEIESLAREYAHHAAGGHPAELRRAAQ